MPVWLLPVAKWIGERFLHLMIYGTIILGVGFALYKLFLKSDNSTRQTYQAPVTNIHNDYKCAVLSCVPCGPTK